MSFAPASRYVEPFGSAITLMSVCGPRSLVSSGDELVPACCASRAETRICSETRFFTQDAELVLHVALDRVGRGRSTRDLRAAGAAGTCRRDAANRRARASRRGRRRRRWNGRRTAPAANSPSASRRRRSRRCRAAAPASACCPSRCAGRSRSTRTWSPSARFLASVCRMFERSCGSPASAVTWSAVRLRSRADASSDAMIESKWPELRRTVASSCAGDVA